MPLASSISNLHHRLKEIELALFQPVRTPWLSNTGTKKTIFPKLIVTDPDESIGTEGRLNGSVSQAARTLDPMPVTEAERRAVPLKLPRLSQLTVKDTEAEPPK